MQAMASDDLREIFTYRDTCISDTHDTLGCKRCRYIAADGVRPSHEAECVSSDDDEGDSDDSSDCSDTSSDSDESSGEESDGSDGVQKKKKKKKQPKKVTKKKKNKPSKKPKKKRAAASEQEDTDGTTSDGGGGGGGGGGTAVADPRTQVQRSGQIGNPSEDQIALWAHHAQKDTILDDVLRGSDRNNNISFVFELRVPPMVVPVP